MYGYDLGIILIIFPTICGGSCCCSIVCVRVCCCSLFGGGGFCSFRYNTVHSSTVSDITGFSMLQFQI